MAKKEPWIPPPDPDFEALATAGWEAFKRDSPELITFDTETTGLEFYDQAFCGQIGWRNSSGIESHYFEIAKRDFSRCLMGILQETPTIVGHNLKFDLQKGILGGWIKREWLESKTLHDTEPLSHLDNEHRPKGLKPLAVSVLGYDDNIAVETKSGPNKGNIRMVPREKYELDAVRRKLKIKKDDGYHLLPRAILLPYALKDVEWTLGLFEILHPLVTYHRDLGQLYKEEMELSLVLLDMEIAGMGVNLEYVRRMAKEYANRVLEIELEIEQIIGKPVGKTKDCFNPNSNPQIDEFFTSKGLGSESYDEEHLEEIDHPFAEVLLRLRKDQKILNTYFRALQKETRNGVFHPSVRQHGTVTGRTSAGGQKGDN